MARHFARVFHRAELRENDMVNDFLPSWRAFSLFYAFSQPGQTLLARYQQINTILSVVKSFWPINTFIFNQYHIALGIIVPLPAQF